MSGRQGAHTRHASELPGSVARRSRRLGAFRLLALPCAVAGCAAAPADVPAAAEGVRFRPIDPRQVKIGGEIGRRIDITVRNNILKIDNETVFLKSFRAKDRRPGSYVGFGKHLDALVRLAFHTRDPGLLALKDRLFAGLIETQLPSGYIGIFGRHHMEIDWDLHEASYVLFALVSDHEHFGGGRSLAAAKKLAAYMMKTRPKRPVVVYVTTTGFERAFIALHRATGEGRYLEHVTVGGSLRNWRTVSGHAYHHLSLCLAQLDLYRLAPDPALLLQSRAAVDMMLDRDAMSVVGTGSNREGWHADRSCGPKFGETCFTAYWLRLLHHLMQIEGDPLYGDVMERTITNALFAAQSPLGRELRKYTPFEGPRSYYRGERGSGFERDAYCCPNNFRRIAAELPDMIFYRARGGVAVNLYAQASARVDLGDGRTVGVRQVTDYPNSGEVVIHVSPTEPARFPVRVRIPRWCIEPKVAVNGEPVGPAKSGTFLVIDRRWHPGDRIALSMPMPLRLVRGRKAQQGRVAVLRGPVLFCLNPALHSGRHPAFAERDAGKRAEFLKGIVIDARSLEGPFPDATVRPGGLACKVKAWSPGAGREGAADLELVLTEYADPGGEATYFVAAGATEVDDELCGGKAR